MSQARHQLLQRHPGLQAPAVRLRVFHVLGSSEGQSVSPQPRTPGPAPTPERRPHLPQRGPAELQGDVVELGSPLGAEVAEHVGVPIRLLQQLHLPPDQAEALTEEPLDRHRPPLKLSPGWRSRGQTERESLGSTPALGFFRVGLSKGQWPPQPSSWLPLTGRQKSHWPRGPGHPWG